MQVTRTLLGICVWCTGAVWHAVLLLCYVHQARQAVMHFLCCLDGVLLMLGRVRVHV